MKCQSQQDLTLADLEGENLTKPPAKSRTAKTTAGGESESPTPVPGPEMAPPQFTWQGENVWTRSVMEGFRTSRLSEPVLPATSPPSPSMPTQPEINRGFQASCEDLPQATTGNSAGRPSSTSSAVLASRPSQPPPPPPPPPAPSNSTEQTGRSSKKSPIKRLTISPTFSRSAEPSLLADADRDTQAETAFTNPALESEWGTFVGQEQSLAKPAGVAVQQDKPVEVLPKKAAPVQARLPEPPAVPKKALPRPLKLPEPEVVAPKPQRTSGAAVKMTEEIEMTEPTQQRMDRGGEISDHSVESTPDHTTSLIKPSQRRRPVEEPEEVLTVAYTQQPAGDGLTQNLLDESDSSIPRTGFDFLDNW